jgi:hypothetical protein
MESKIRIEIENGNLKQNLSKSESYTFVTSADRRPKLIKLLLVLLPRTIHTKYKILVL